MKIILQRDVPNLGRSGGIIDVSDAYGRNFLLPKKLGRVAGAKEIERSKYQQQKKVATEAKRAERMRQDREMAATVKLILNAKSNPQGKLFAALRGADIIQAGHQAGLDLANCRLSPDVIKSTGQHVITVQWPDREQADITLEVVSA